MPRELALPLFDPPPKAPNKDWPQDLTPADPRARKPRRQEQYEREFAFQCQAFKLPAPLQQFLFAKALDRRFTADFAWPAYRLLVEVQGGIWRPGGGAHSHPQNIERDVEKAQCVALLGYVLLPITPKNLKSGIAIELTQRVLRARGWKGVAP